MMNLPEDLERKIFIGCAAGALALSGFFVGAFAPGSKKFAETVGERIEDINRNGLAYLGVRPSGHLAPYRAEIIEQVRLAEGRAAPGVTLVTGLFGDKLAARLYDRAGAIAYEWPIDLFDLFPETKSYKFDALVHGDYLYPNGDILVLIDHVGLARISACGDVLWRKRNGAHHSIDVDDDGFIWTPRGGKYYDDSRLGAEPMRIDRISKYDPETGEVLETIELARVLVESGYEGIVKGSTPKASDVFHLNDVEILKKPLAAAFPMFSAGDIMISGRNTNEIIVLDGETRKVKWWRAGPMHGQHDPDFQASGAITVLDNRTAQAASAENGFTGGAHGSRIIAINPSEYGYRELYASNEFNKFYTAYRGKHQVLENGNILITESEAGRVFEATPDGRIAWMIVSRYDDKTVGWLTSATRYPESHATAVEGCPAASRPQ